MQGRKGLSGVVHGRILDCDPKCDEAGAVVKGPNLSYHRNPYIYIYTYPNMVTELNSLTRIQEDGAHRNAGGVGQLRRAGRGGLHRAGGSPEAGPGAPQVRV